MDGREQDNFDRARSHFIADSLNSSLTEFADKFNASVMCLIRTPNGTQHSAKQIILAGGGIEYYETEDGQLTKELWERHWNKKQGNFIV